MSLKINEELLLQAIDDSLSSFVKDYADLCYDVIDKVRYWENWTTSDPYRDIVDTTALRNSMERKRLSRFRWSVTWSVPYVLYVYYGYITQKGNIIPARKWAEIAIAENDLHGLFSVWLRFYLKMI